MKAGYRKGKFKNSNSKFHCDFACFGASIHHAIHNHRMAPCAIDFAPLGLSYADAFNFRALRTRLMIAPRWGLATRTLLISGRCAPG